ncbi:MAG: hypothetical protein OEW19_18410, partial [Acidobacteriota bacterium]|nr:hypothetical protein [Acidobacteriota bacterium]
MSVPTPYLTVDVEDWLEGMFVLGHDIPRTPRIEPGLTCLRGLLAGSPRHVTLFVVGRHARRLSRDL